MSFQITDEEEFELGCAERIADAARSLGHDLDFVSVFRPVGARCRRRDCGLTISDAALSGREPAPEMPPCSGGVRFLGGAA